MGTRHYAANFPHIHINPLGGGAKSAALSWLKTGVGPATKGFKALGQILSIASDKRELAFLNDYYMDIAFFKRQCVDYQPFK